MKNILVTVEFEQQFEKLISKARDLATKYNAKLWLLHVAAPDPDFVGYAVGPTYIRKSRANELKKEHQTLDEYAKQLQNDGIESDGLLIQGATAQTILEEAEKLNCDLLVIGHHQHSWFYKLFGQPTDLEVIEKSNIPVLIVPIGN
ncbi:MAG: universal stress protein [Bacteroidia bacterium]